MRLDKLLANMGCGSRKDVKKLVKQGVVCINGIETKDAAAIIDENTDVVTVLGKEVQYKNTYIL